MEKRVQQETARESSLPERRSEKSAGQSSKASREALRAVAVISAGDRFQALVRPEDVLALSALAGNSALRSLLTAKKPSLTQPFSYHPFRGMPEPFAVHPAPLELCEQEEITAGSTELEPFPAAALSDGAWTGI